MTTRVTPRTTLLLKLTPGEGSEAAALARGGQPRTIGPRSRPSGGVLVIRDAPRQDTVTLGRRSFDLRTDDGRRRFAESLPLDGERRGALAEVVKRAGPASRDELAQLARVLSWAETGKLQLDRLVLSGHWHPFGMRGEMEGPRQNGSLDFRDLRRVLALFPAAARQVQHLMLAICFRGRMPNPAGLDSRASLLQSYRELFPGLQSVTGYGERAHLSGQGAEQDLRRWASATQGRAPERDQIFGPCPSRPTRGAAQRRAAGVLHTPAFVQSCR